MRSVDRLSVYIASTLGGVALFCGPVAAVLYNQDLLDDVALIGFVLILLPLCILHGWITQLSSCPSEAALEVTGVILMCLSLATLATIAIMVAWNDAEPGIPIDLRTAVR